MNNLAGTTIEQIKQRAKKNKLTSNIENKIDKYETDSDSSSDEEEKPKKRKQKKTKKSSFNFSLPFWMHEPLIIFILYVVLSLDITRNMVGKYISILAPDEDGNIGIIGVMLYGIILCSVFIIIKKLKN